MERAVQADEDLLAHLLRLVCAQHAHDHGRHAGLVGLHQAAEGLIVAQARPLREVPGELLQGALALALALPVGIGPVCIGPGGLAPAPGLAVQVVQVIAQAQAGVVPVHGLPVGDVLQHVQAADAVAVQEVDGKGVLLLEHGGDDVAHVHGLLAGGLLLPHGALHDAAHAQGLDHLALGVLGQGVHVLAEKRLQLLAQPVHVGPAGVQHVGACRLARHGVEQVLQGQVFVAAAPHLVEGAGEDGFESLAQHDAHTSSMLARRG